MSGFLRRLLGRGRAPRVPVTCYLRENGPLAYELALFGAGPRDRAEMLLESALNWAWSSDAREWTELTRVSLPAFLADLPRGALIVGGESDLPANLTDDTVKDWVRRFCHVEPVPLSAAISVTPDRQLLFVQQHAPAPVNALLETLGIDRRAAARSAYARLGPASLERVAERL